MFTAQGSRMPLFANFAAKVQKKLYMRKQKLRKDSILRNFQISF